ncbi:MAG: dephospho-CoA kinase [Planctomycetota bacterium]|jgi:dephospho-CoA kinase
MPAPPTGNPGPNRPFRPQTPLVIGLVGGIAAGKSKVASLFSSHGILHVNADFHAKAVAEDPQVLAEVATQLGERFVQGTKLDRAALGDHVFRNPNAKAQLEAIMHPRVRSRITEALELAQSQGQSALLDVPLLFEAGLFEACDTIVFVEARDEIRAERARGRGWADDELMRREQNQLPLAEKRARSQHVIDNNGDLSATEQTIDALLLRLESNV